MVGHFLLHLTPAAEDRVLTTAMLPAMLGGPCLLIAIHQNQNPNHEWLPNKCGWGDMDCPIGRRFDALCIRFGVRRTTAAIRNRILSNRARRTLQNRPASEPVLIGVVR